MNLTLLVVSQSQSLAAQVPLTGLSKPRYLGHAPVAQSLPSTPSSAPAGGRARTGSKGAYLEMDSLDFGNEKFSLLTSSLSTGRGAYSNAGKSRHLASPSEPGHSPAGRVHAARPHSVSPTRLTFSERELLTERSFPGGGNLILACRVGAAVGRISRW